MGLAIEVEFVRGLFEAGTSGPDRTTEWPPSPARLFNGLVAVAETDAHDAALRWLEVQPPPYIEVPDSAAPSMASASFVPLNETVKTSTYRDLPARKAGDLRRWVHVAVADRPLRYWWPTELPGDLVGPLRELVEELPYLGRASSPVTARMVTDWPMPEPGEDRTVIIAGGLTDPVSMSVPSDGYLAALRDAFDDGRSAHEVPRRLLRYGRDTPPRTAVHASPFETDFLVLPFADRRLPSIYAVPISQGIRKAMESHTDGGPLVLRGARHGEPSPQFQVLILPLPNVGHEYSDGLVSGVGIVLPKGIDEADRLEIYSAIRAVETNGVVLGRLGKLSFAFDVPNSATLNPARWTRASRTWASATPLVLDRYVRQDRPAELEAEVVKACTFAGLPEPNVTVSSHPLIPGAADVPARLRIRRAGESARPAVHCRLIFDEPVEGPVVLGHLRRYGLGLFAPEARQ